VLTKTSLMLGLGETTTRSSAACDDLREARVDILTLGQYLRPTVNHLPVERFVTPDEFRVPRPGAGPRASSSASRARWSVRATVPSARSNATTRDSDVVPVARWLGRAEYEPTWRAMQRYTETREPDARDELWCLEHPPVYTLGLNGKPEHVLAAGDIPVVNIDRGGQVTYHGPGQLVVYPLVDLRRSRLGVRELVVALEEAPSSRSPPSTGSRPRRAARRRASTWTGGSSRASACGSAAGAAITASR
jgi:hypothetical protein